VPALPPYIIEPIWQQFSALLPEREVDHPLGCHRPVYPTEWSSRSWFRCWCSDALTGASLRRAARPPL
jgi:hypothetical protein